jgi:hypothetical protein
MGINLNARPSELIRTAGALDPIDQSAGARVSDYASLAEAERGLAIVLVGAMTSNSTVDAKLVQATDSSGTGKKDISGKAITQLTEAGSDNNKQVLLEVLAEELDVNNGFTHFAVEVTTATAASLTAAVVQTYGIAHGPASDGDVASVDEIVN